MVGGCAMPRLRAAGYKYAALPDVVGQKSAQELEREELEATWKQKTADMWANAELEVPQAQARRVQQRERKASRAVTVPLPPRAGATSPTRERRKITTASPSRDGRRAATEKPPQGQQLEDRTNRAPSSGEGRPPPRDTVTAVQQQPSAAKGWKTKNTAMRTVLTEQVPSKTMKKKRMKKKLKKKKQAGDKRPASNDKTEEPTSQLMLHEISVGRLGSGGVGRLSIGRPSPVQEQSSGAEDVVSSDSDSDSEPESESESVGGGDCRERGAQGTGGQGPETQIVAPPRGFGDLERQFRTVEASLPVAEREVLADDLQNIARAISSMSLQQGTTDDSHVAVSGRADRAQRSVGDVQDNDGSSANHGIDESQQNWSESSDEDRDDVREFEPVQPRSESHWKLHTDVASGEQFEIHSITQEVRWVGAEADKSEPTIRAHTNAIHKGGPPSAANPLIISGRGRRRSSNNQMPPKPHTQHQRSLAARHPQHRQAERSLTRKTRKPPRSQNGLVRESAGAGEAKVLRRKKSQPHKSAVHDSGKWGGVETGEERQVRLKAEHRKEQEERRPVSAESEMNSSDDDYDDDDGYSDPDEKSPRSDDKEGYDSSSNSDSTSHKAAQGRDKRSKRPQAQQAASDRREKVSSHPIKEFDLREPGYRRAGRRRGSRDGIFETTMGFGDEPESLIALEEKWQVYPFRSLRFSLCAAVNHFRICLGSGGRFHLLWWNKID